MKKRTAFKPTSAGTLVVPGRGGSLALYCEGNQRHVWRAGEAVKTDPLSHSSGYAQVAVCAECRDSKGPLDAYWWATRATAADLAEARRRLRLRIQELRERLKVLT